MLKLTYCSTSSCPSQVREQEVKLKSSAAIGHDQCREGIEQKAEPELPRLPRNGSCVAMAIQKIDEHISFYLYHPICWVLYCTST